jgi:hypothetical protein
MATVIGWIIIAALMYALGLLLTLPAYVLARRRSDVRSGWLRCYWLAGAAAGGLTLWFLIPLIASLLFGRHAA